MNISTNRLILKRILDIALLIPLIIVLLPLIAIVTLLIIIDLRFPVFFCQVRPGLHGNPFVFFKFRTMRNDYDEFGRPLSDRERLTMFGKLLRHLSIDELPTLFNVFKGQMSFVGPRPLLMEYLDRYSPEQARRHEVKPGITGWAQVNGRNAITWEEKFKYDVWYVDNWSLWLDLKILWMTLLKVARKEGINYPGQATMPVFRGSNPKHLS